MRLGACLRDRALYIGVYAVFGLVTVKVVQLDLRLSGASPQRANLLYLWTLGMVGLLIFLAADYHRQAAFLRRLARPGPDQPLDELALLPEPRTLEQHSPRPGPASTPGSGRNWPRSGSGPGKTSSS